MGILRAYGGNRRDWGVGDEGGFEEVGGIWVGFGEVCKGLACAEGFYECLSILNVFRRLPDKYIP